MSDILIFSPDSVFSCMLVLELADAELPSRVADRFPESADGVLIVDGEAPADALAGLSDRTRYPYVIVIGCDPACHEREDLLFVRRPVSISFLVAAVRHLMAGENVKSAKDIVEMPVLPACPALEIGRDYAVFCGEHIALTRREAELLSYLYKRRGHAVSRGEAVKNVWRYDYTGNTNIVDVYIRYLRRKLDEHTGVRLIRTVRGSGYMIAADEVEKNEV